MSAPEKRSLSLLTSGQFLAALALLSACTIVLFFLEFRREKVRALEAVESSLAERLNALEHTVALTAGSVNLLRSWAGSILDGDGEAIRSPLPEDLAYSPDGDYFELPETRVTGKRGNILGVGPLEGRERPFYRDLNLTLNISPLLAAAQGYSPAIIHSYLVTNTRLSSTFPYVAAAVLIANAAPEGTLRQAFDVFYDPHTGQHLNPRRDSYWTDVYRDRSGEGLMVTYAAPIYTDDEHVGLLAADITLAFLERFVEQFAGPTGRFIIATGGAQVLADSGGASRGDALSLADVLPASLAGEAGDILEGKRSFSHSIDGTYVYSRKLDSAPWVFIHLLRESDLSSHISPTRMTYGIALLLFSSFLLLTWFALRQRAAEAALGQSEMRYSEVFNATGDAIFIHDTESGAIVEVNSTMLDLYGYSREEALRLQVGDLSASAPPWTQEEAQRLIKKAVDGEPQIFEWRAKRKGGELFWVEVALSSSIIAGQGRVLAVVRDITERRRLEKENIEVRDQVIQEMKYHEDYVSEIAHRLRNPLQVLMGHLEFFDSSNLRLEQKAALASIRESLGKIEEGIKKLT